MNDDELEHILRTAFGDNKQLLDLIPIIMNHIEDIRMASAEFGYNEGHEAGYNEGYRKGYDTGHDEGKREAEWNE